MALTAASLTHGSDLTFNPSILTGSISPGANNYETIVILSNNVIPTGLSVSGNSLTWVQVYSDSNQGANRAVNAWRALGASPSAGSILISNPNGCGLMWDVIEVSGGVDTMTPMLQTSQGFGASPTDAGLAATAATSVILGFTGDRDTTSVLTPGAGFTQLNNFVDSSGLVGTLGTQWVTGVTTGACGWSWTSGNNHSVFGFEIQVAAAPPPPADTFIAAWGMQAPAINRGLPTMVASGSRPGTRVS